MFAITQTYKMVWKGCSMRVVQSIKLAAFFIKWNKNQEKTFIKKKHVDVEFQLIKTSDLIQ